MKKRGRSASPRRRAGRNTPNIITVLLWALIAYIVISYGFSVAGNRDMAKPSISEVVSSIQADEIRDITVSGQEVEITYRDGTEGQTQKRRVHLL